MSFNDVELRRRRRLIPLCATALCLALPGCDEAPREEHAAAGSPYAGHEHRDIKALSAEETAGLLAGEGLSQALAAELNGYPGPKHVLELVRELDLNGGQLQRTQAIYERMKDRAVALGAQIVHAERALDSEFAAGSLGAAELEERVREIAGLRGELRALHLATHLNMRDVLDSDQVARYARLRGYHGG